MADKQTPPQKMVIKCGFPVRTVSFKIIKLITTFLAIFLLIDVIFSFHLFVSAIRIRGHLGYFINMISSGDGDILPTMQAIPVFFFFLTNMVMVVNVYVVHDQLVRPGLNRMMFVMVVLGAILLIILLIMIICVISHAYSAHESLHDGIVTAMKNYSNNLVYKEQIDHLQIEFQCCGSKKYDEWYTMKWLDPSLEQDGSSSRADGNTPFSCCSMKSLFPCIHHRIEVTGKAYLYTPEYNLSISTRGCYEMIREKKQEIGWMIVLNLFLYLVLECFTVALFRCIQTGHFEESKFSGNSRTYTIWVFGSYSGKVKEEEAPAPPPELPPVPPELLDTD